MQKEVSYVAAERVEENYDSEMIVFWRTKYKY